MKIVISSGHAKYVRGASGYPIPPQLDEVDEARKVVETVADKLRIVGVEVTTFHDDVSTSQNENLNRIVDFHNSQPPHDYDISVHFNAYDGSAHGVEVLYVTQSSLAAKVSEAIADAGAFVDRGAKYRSDLFFLNQTAEKSLLLETCFCDNTSDSNLYHQHYDSICEAIAETISGQDVPDAEQPPEEIPPVGPEENHVDITVAATGNVTVIANDQHYVVGNPECRDRVVMTLAARGNVHVVVNGEDFHGSAPPPAETGEPDVEIPGNQKNITATVFGGADDPNYSAYPPYDSSGNGRYLNDTDYYVALPFKLQGERPKVRVWNPTNELSKEATIEDVGPWCTTDDYFNKGTRPVAETCNHNGTPLPSGSGPNAGKVPSNDAGIDLSPALADAIGISGKGKVDWDFVEPVA
jgi:hypothetical protein